jgi:hypothetical protein
MTYYYLNNFLMLLYYKMSCSSCKYSPRDSLQTTWTQSGDLIQNNYTPPYGWPFDPKNTWPVGVAEGYTKASNYAQSSVAWRRISNVTPDNTDYMNTLPIGGMPTMYAEKYTSTSRPVSASNFSTLKNTWTLPKPYST